MTTLFQDVRFAVRMLRKAPGFAAIASCVLALGIGATTTIFSFINGALLRPLPGIDDPDRLITLGSTFKGEGFNDSSYPNYRALREQNSVFTDVAAEHPLPVSVSTGGRADRLQGSVVTANYFHTLGVHFAQGRGFLDSEDIDGNAQPVVVISDALWSRRFARDDRIVGTAISVDGRPMTVVGIAPRGFIGSNRASAIDVWVPMGAARQVLPSWIDLDEQLRHPGWGWIMLYARLKPGVSVERAAADVQAVAGRLRSAEPEDTQNAFGWTLAPGVGLDPDEHRDLARMSGILFGVGALLLLLACANVSGLLLTRAAARTREMTMRLALGARRGRLVRQLLTESVLLAVVGGVGGLGSSFWAAAALSRFLAASDRFPLAVDISPDWRVLAFTAGVCAITGIAFGVAPAWRASQVNLVSGLKAAAALAPRRSRLRPLLVVAQLALSLMLLSGAGLLLRTVWNLSQIRAGFDSRDLALMTVEPTLTRRYSDAQLRHLYEQLLARVQAVPGIESATLARVPPVSAHGWGVNARIPDKPNDSNRGLQYNTVAPNYFRMMGIPLIRGRGFDPEDTATAPGVMVVNETMARAVWPGEDPLGKHVVVADETIPREVVGVVPDLKYRSLLESPRPLVYFSMWQPYPLPDAPTVIHLRTRMSLPDTAAAVRREVQALDPNLPLFDVKSVADQIADSYWRQRMTGLLVGVFACIALVLSIAGTYGVMSSVVAERTREVGIRIALGADGGDVARLIIVEGAAMVGFGVALGTGGALAATRLLQSLLYGVTARDPIHLVLSAAVLVAAGILASYLPARRAARVDPLAALRFD